MQGLFFDHNEIKIQQEKEVLEIHKCVKIKQNIPK